MNRVRLLSEQVANQIAAGEVVERPASVVKELVENALDAQSTRVSIEIQAGGRSLIRVSDDGIGMSRDDALLCLERHATSKIQRAEDLAAVATMGFRGEALPSIASVSRMLLTTREGQGSEAGTQVSIHGGKLLEVKAAGAPPGTSIEVRHLFYNLPARRKFLRSEETEYAHVHHYLTLAALAHPRVGFTFTKDGRVVWQLPPVPPEAGRSSGLASLRERVRVLMGAVDDLLPVDVSESLAEEVAAGEDASLPGSAIRLWGFIGRPGVSRANRQDQHVFVNRRPVESRAVNYALLEGYRTALMKGRYPVCCLFLEVDPAAVDVNIHPAKREVKFRDERGVRQFVSRSVRQALSSAEPEPKPAAPAPPGASKEAPVPESTSKLPPPQDTPHPQDLPHVGNLTSYAPPPELELARPPSYLVPRPAPLPSGPAAGSGPGLDQGRNPPPAAASAETPPSSATGPEAGIPRAEQPPGQPAGLMQVPLRLLGVIGNLYVLMESDRGLVLMDQHAAHERILFEQMLARLEEGTVASQRLLLPETIELSIRDAHQIRELLPLLNRLGVGLGEFGERTFLLDALPPFVTVAEPRRFVLELIDELRSAGQEVNPMRLGEEMIAKTVCRHAVKAHDPLTMAELEKLVADLRRCAMPYTCPHGRPTLLEINYRELEKKFGRITP